MSEPSMVDVVVVRVRPSRSQEGMDAVFMAVDDPTGNDDRILTLHAPANTHEVREKVQIVIDEHGQPSWAG